MSWCVSWSPFSSSWAELKGQTVFSRNTTKTIGLLSGQKEFSVGGIICRCQRCEGGNPPLKSCSYWVIFSLSSIVSWQQWGQKMHKEQRLKHKEDHGKFVSCGLVCLVRGVSPADGVRADHPSVKWCLINNNKICSDRFVFYMSRRATAVDIDTECVWWRHTHTHTHTHTLSTAWCRCVCKVLAVRCC